MWNMWPNNAIKLKQSLKAIVGVMDRYQYKHSKRQSFLSINSHKWTTEGQRYLPIDLRMTLVCQKFNTSLIHQPHLYNKSSFPWKNELPIAMLQIGGSLTSSTRCIFIFKECFKRISIQTFFFQYAGSAKKWECPICKGWLVPGNH